MIHVISAAILPFYASLMTGNAVSNVRQVPPPGEISYLRQQACLPLHVFGGHIIKQSYEKVIKSCEQAYR